jgi:hypothetical protein
VTMIEKLAHLFEPVWRVVEPLVPGALGAAVGQAWERGLGWRDRLIQWVVGLIIAAYVVPAIGHVFNWHQTLTAAVGFVFGTIAFKAVGVWREAAVQSGVDIFRALPGIARSWWRRPGAAPEVIDPAKPEGEG